MGRVIVVQYITLDGVVEDPDGSDGTTGGGWAMRYGPEGIAGDKFRLSSIMQTGVLPSRMSEGKCSTSGLPGIRSPWLATTCMVAASTGDGSSAPR